MEQDSCLAGPCSEEAGDHQGACPQQANAISIKAKETQDVMIV